MPFLILVSLLLGGSLCPAADQAPLRPGVSVSQTRLSLAEAVERALKANLEIEIEQTNRATAAESVTAARAYLDPSFRWLPSVESRNTPTGSLLAPASGKITERFFTQDFTFRQRTPFEGLVLQADFQNVRQSTNNPFVALNPFITPRLVVGASLPLLRDRKIDRERADLLIRRKQADLSDVTFDLRVIDVVTRVEQAYYDLVTVRADLDVVMESVSLAREQLDRTRRMIDSGTMAPVELAGAEAELERRQDSYLSTLNLLNQAEINLKTLIAAGRGDEIWRDIVVPISTEQVATPPDAAKDLADLTEAAVAQRAEFRALTVRKDVNETQRQLARNQDQVQFNLTGAYISSGLAGTLAATGNPFASSQEALVSRLNELSARAGLAPVPNGSVGGSLPDSLIGGYGQSLGNLFSGRYSTVQAGVALDWNWRNTAARSALAQTAITDRRLDLEKRQMEQGIQAQVRIALQSIATSRQRITAAEASARAAKEKLDSEVRLFQSGESTNFLVLTRQNELADSRRRVVAATQEFNRSVARFAFALGKSLEQYGLRTR
jgi:HAE1 family hydrophobic/amphiphilic exporter-1